MSREEMFQAVKEAILGCEEWEQVPDRDQWRLKFNGPYVHGELRVSGEFIENVVRRAEP